jgi:O-antigen ligase
MSFAEAQRVGAQQWANSRARVPRQASPKEGTLLTSFARGSLWLFAFTIPLENAFILPGVGTMGRLVGLGAFVIGVLAVLDSGKLRPLSATHLLMAAYVGWASITYFWSAAPDTTTEVLQSYVQLLAVVWLIWELVPQPHQQMRLMQAYLLGTAVFAITTIVQNYSDPSAFQRQVAFNINPNDAGLRLALSVPLAFYLAATEKRTLLAWLYRLQIMVAACGLFFTASRGALLALCVALLMIPLSFRMWTRRQRMTMGVAIAFAAIAAVTLVPSTAWQRMATAGTEIQSGTMNDRTVIWRTGLEVFADHPFIGVGAGGFGAGLQRKMSFSWAAHNTFLSVLVEQGVIGFAIFLFLLVTLAYSTFGIPVFERNLWLVMLSTWAVGVSAMTWENSKPTWFLFGLLSTSVAALAAASNRYSLARARAFWANRRAAQPVQVVQVADRMKAVRELHLKLQKAGIEASRPGQKAGS